MKRTFILMMGIILTISVAYSQQSVIPAENFDSNSYDDILSYYYVSDKQDLPINECFSSRISIAFESKNPDTFHKWQVIAHKCRYSNNSSIWYRDVLFRRQSGSYGKLYLYKNWIYAIRYCLLFFRHFHDTISCEDYTDVHI
jgi:hypothetical protein